MNCTQGNALYIEERYKASELLRQAYNKLNKLYETELTIALLFFLFLFFISKSIFNRVQVVLKQKYKDIVNITKSNQGKVKPKVTKTTNI